MEKKKRGGVFQEVFESIDADRGSSSLDGGVPACGSLLPPITNRYRMEYYSPIRNSTHNGKEVDMFKCLQIPFHHQQIFHITDEMYQKKSTLR